MKKTFTTMLPDKVGAFLKASAIVSELGLNIIRVSYNKAVDTYILFLEVEGDGRTIDEASYRLEAAGYIKDYPDSGNVILLEFILPDKPGSLLPVLELINEYNFNISYMSSQKEDGKLQHFRMGLHTDGGNAVSEFMGRVSLLCPLKVLSYNPGEQVLDNTVFYLSFANRIAEKLNLNKEQKMGLIINSNLIMEILRDRPVAQMETFNYISNFADALHEYHGYNFNAGVFIQTLGEDVTLMLVEPPCGSNVWMLRRGNDAVFADGGMCCYHDETLAAIYSAVPDFEALNKCMILSHADVDHCGILDCFDRIYMSESAARNFHLEHEDKENLREQNPLHAPYVNISKILSGYVTPEISHILPVGGSEKPQKKPFEYIGKVYEAGLVFEVYEGKGGHVEGEVVYIERELHLVFTGDIFVNVRECDKRQMKFNTLAPYLMTSVDTNPDFAKSEREALPLLLGNGEWLICGGHGRIKKIKTEE